jgi:tetratricopeptide (TPR) repeat protein
VLVVLADGEDPIGAGDAGAAALARADTRLVAIALGLDTGALVPDGRAPLRDADGRPVRSQRDAARLARWAAASDGASFEADRWGEIDLARAAAEIRRDAGHGPDDTVLRRVPAVRTGPLAALALALLWLEWAGAGRRRPDAPRARGERLFARWTQRRARATAAFAVSVALAYNVARAGAQPPGIALSPASAARAGAQLESELRARPGDSALLVALGVARAEAGDRDGAVHALRAAAVAARDPALAALAWYDLGVLAIDARVLERARDAFLDALALRPDDEQARFNLEWTLRALRAEPPEPPPAGGESGDDPSDDETQREPAPSDEPDRATQDPADAPQPDDGAPARPRFAPTLGDDEVERWLSRIDDAATQALRAAAGSDDEPRASRQAAPAW